MSIMPIIIRIRNAEIRMSMSSRENASTEGGADRTLRRVRFAAGVKARTGINDAMIQDLVHAFDERVRADPMLGSKFEARNSSA